MILRIGFLIKQKACQKRNSGAWGKVRAWDTDPSAFSSTDKEKGGSEPVWAALPPLLCMRKTSCSACAWGGGLLLVILGLEDSLVENRAAVALRVVGVGKGEARLLEGHHRRRVLQFRQQCAACRLRVQPSHAVCRTRYGVVVVQRARLRLIGQAVHRQVVGNACRAVLLCVKLGLVGRLLLE